MERRRLHDADRPASRQIIRTHRETSSPGRLDSDRVESTRGGLRTSASAIGDPDTSRVVGAGDGRRVEVQLHRAFARSTIGLPTDRRDDSAFNVTSLDTSDVSRPVRLHALGTMRGPLRLSATERGSSPEAGTTFNVALRSRELQRMRSAGVSAFAEGEERSIRSRGRRDRAVHAAVVRERSRIDGSHDGRSRRADSSFTASYVRAEAGLRVHNLWLLGGVMRRDSVRLAPPRVRFAIPRLVRSRRASEWPRRARRWRFAARSGELFSADVAAVRWNDTTGFYRPRYQTRSELFVRTNCSTAFRPAIWASWRRSSTNIGRARTSRSANGGRRTCRAIARSRRCSRFAFSARRCRGSSGICSASATPGAGLVDAAPDQLLRRALGVLQLTY